MNVHVLSPIKEETPSNLKKTPPDTDDHSKDMIFPDVSKLERPKIAEFEMTVSPRNKSTTQSKSPISSKKKTVVDLEDIAPILEKLRKNLGEELINIRKEEEDSKLSYDKMCTAVNENHARNRKNKRYDFSEACCDVETGYHCCCGTSKNTEFEKFGVGINLYFKFLKYLMVFFLLFALLSVPSFYFSAEAAKNMKNFSISTYSNLLFASTIGTFGYNTFSCGETQIEANQTILLDCDVDFMDANNTIYGLLAPKYYSTDGCFYIDQTNLDTSCATTTLQDYINTNCQNQTFCSFLPNASFFNSSAECQEKINVEKYYTYFQVYCKSDYLTLTGGAHIDKSLIPIIIAFFDAGIVLSYIFMLISLGVSQKKAINNVLHNSLSPSLYTLEVTNLPNNLDKESLIIGLWRHMENVLNTAYKKFDKEFQVVDIQVAQRNRAINLSYKKGELLKKRNKMIREWAKKYDKDRSLPELVLLSHLKNCIVVLESPVQTKAKYDLYLIEQVDLKVAQLEEKLQNAEDDHKLQFKAAWVTFETMKQRDLAYNYFFTTSLERCCYTCCQDTCVDASGKLFMDKQLQCSTAPDPSNINWLNINHSKLKKTFRRFISVILTVGLLIGTFSLIVYIKIQQQDVLAQYPNIDCSNRNNVTISEVEADYSLPTKQGLLECYCKVDLTNRLNDEFMVNGKETKLCSTWLQKDLFINLLPFLIVMVIVTLNMVMQTLFKLLSSFEKHKYLSAELASRVIKIFIAQFLNTGMILLIMNIQFQETNNAASALQNIIHGKYYDFTPLWFDGVGTVVLLTMFINMFSTPIMVIIFHLIVLCKRAIDQRCKCDRRISKKKTQKSYEDLYMGPEFFIDFRYAQILTSVFVCFLYSAGLPFLYVTTFIQLFMIYWLDKIFILKICRLPKNIDEEIEMYVKDILFCIIIVHLLFAIWIYGDSKIFPETLSVSIVSDYQNYAESFLSDNNFNGGYFEIFKTRVLKTQNIILLILLLVILAYMVAVILFWRPFKKMMEACCKKCSHKGFFSVKNKLSKMNFFKVMSKEQLKKEKILTKVTLNEIGSKIKPEYKEKLENKIKMIDENFKIRTSVEFANYKFIGLPSYDLRENPRFKEMYAIDEFITQN